MQGSDSEGVREAIFKSEAKKPTKENIIYYYCNWFYNTTNYIFSHFLPCKNIHLFPTCFLTILDHPNSLRKELRYSVEDQLGMLLPSVYVIQMHVCVQRNTHTYTCSCLYRCMRAIFFLKKRF